jgi:hypothetical protein
MDHVPLDVEIKRALKFARNPEDRLFEHPYYWAGMQSIGA